MGFFSDILEKHTSPWRLLLGKGTDRDEKIFSKELENLVTATSPFRMGANLLAQGYGPVFRALTGQDPNTPGAVESFIREGISPEEQDYLERKPYTAALKSGAGMTTALMPFATGGLGTLNYVANPLINKSLQYGLSGLVPGALGGFSYSGEGNELRDTLLGGGIGTATSLLGGYVFDPEYRELLKGAYADATPGGMYRGSLGGDIESLREKAFKEANLSKGEVIKLEEYYKGMGVDRDPYINDIELLQRGEKTQAGLDYMKALKDQGLVDPGQVNLPIKGYEAALSLGKERKYSKTVNIQDRDDLEYLERILNKEQIDEIKSGKTTNFRGDSYEDLAKVNIVSETPQTIEQKLSGKISDVNLRGNTFYHGTSSGGAKEIMQGGFKKGSELSGEAYRGGGYGKIQDSISLTEDPKVANVFAQLSEGGEVVEVKLKPNAKVVSIKGVDDAMDIEDYLPYLKKKGIDAVYLGGGEEELIVLDSKSIIPIRTSLGEFWKKAWGK